MSVFNQMSHPIVIIAKYDKLTYEFEYLNNDKIHEIKQQIVNYFEIEKDSAKIIGFPMKLKDKDILDPLSFKSGKNVVKLLVLGKKIHNIQKDLQQETQKIEKQIKEQERASFYSKIIANQDQEVKIIADSISSEKAKLQAKTSSSYNFQQRDNWILLEYCILGDFKNVEITMRITGHRIDPNFKNGYPLYLCVTSGSLESFQYLIETRGANVVVVGGQYSYNGQLFRQAIKFGRLNILKYLIESTKIYNHREIWTTYNPDVENYSEDNSEELYNHTRRVLLRHCVNELPYACTRHHLHILTYLLRQMKDYEPKLISSQLLNSCIGESCKNGDIWIMDELINNWKANGIQEVDFMYDFRECLQLSVLGKQIHTFITAFKHCKDEDIELNNYSIIREICHFGFLEALQFVHQHFLHKNYSKIHHLLFAESDSDNAKSESDNSIIRSARGNHALILEYLLSNGNITISNEKFKSLPEYVQEQLFQVQYNREMRQIKGKSIVELLTSGNIFPKDLAGLVATRICGSDGRKSLQYTEQGKAMFGNENWKIEYETRLKEIQKKQEEEEKMREKRCLESKDSFLAPGITSDRENLLLSSSSSSNQNEIESKNCNNPDQEYLFDDEGNQLIYSCVNKTNTTIQAELKPKNNDENALSLDDEELNDDQPNVESEIKKSTNQSLVLVSNDNTSFTVMKLAAIVSTVVKSALAKDPDAKSITLPSIDSKTLKFIVDFMIMYHKETEEVAKRWIENVHLSLKEMKSIISACFYMDIALLQELVINKFVMSMKGKKFSEILQIRDLLSK